MNNKNINIIISGGGTGGHIFPAIAIANELKRKINDVNILFVGAKNRMEMEKVPQAGYKIEGLCISGLQRSLSYKNLLFPFKVIFSIIKAIKIVKNFRPNIAIGVGGYASAPLLYAATLNKIPTLIQEQNSYAGLTNKLLSKKVNKICVAYPNMEKYFPKEKIVLTGNPIRQNIIEVSNKEDALKYFGLDANKKTILVIGGSLGARTINDSIYNGLESFKDKNIQIVWQTGKLYSDKANEICKKYDFVKSYDFITNMNYAYLVADIVVSRAGALSISELCVCKKASILVPSPNVAEDHQTKNAMALVNEEAALIVKDIEAREKLIDAIANLINNEETIAKLEKNIEKFAFVNATENIVNEIIKILKI